MQIFTGFEPTKLCGVDVDVLQTTEHDARYVQDLQLVKRLGITMLRVAVPWHRIEKQRGVFDWQWFDAYVEQLSALGIEPIFDPLHHCSFGPETDFLDALFPMRYLQFIVQLLERYPHVTKYTLVNEPTVTAHFSCGSGIWPPHVSGKYKEAMRNLLDVFTTGSALLRYNKKEHWYVDACNPARNPERFTFLDKLLKAGVTIDVLGLDYYPHCDDMHRPTTFYSIAKEYYERYKLPIALTETNIRGFVQDRQTWFVYMYKQCLQLEQEVPFRGFCWYPFIDSRDWASLLQRHEGHLDPVGIIWLDADNNRHENEFSNNIKLLNSGQITIADVPTYAYQPPLNQTLKNFIQ